MSNKAKWLFPVSLLLMVAVPNVKASTSCQTKIAEYLGSKSSLKNLGQLYDISRARVSIRNELSREKHTKLLERRLNDFVSKAFFSGNLTGEQWKDAVKALTPKLNIGQRWLLDQVTRKGLHHHEQFQGLAKYKPMTDFVESITALIDKDVTLDNSVTDSLAATFVCTLATAPFLPVIWNGFPTSGVSELSIAIGLTCGGVAGFSKYMLKQHIKGNSLQYDFDKLGVEEISRVEFDSLLTQFAEETRLTKFQSETDYFNLIDDMRAVLQLTGWGGDNLESLLDLIALSNPKLIQQRTTLRSMVLN